MMRSKHRARFEMPAKRIVPLAIAIMAGSVGAPASATQTSDARPSFGTQAERASQSNRELSNFSDLAEAVKPSVIGVRTEPDPDKTVPQPVQSGPVTPFGLPDEGPTTRDNRPSVRAVQGSGFFITADGYAVTTGHVVADRDSVQIETDDGSTYTAKVVGADPTSDLALLKVDAQTSFVPAKIGKTAPRVGEWVVSIGNPFGLGGTVTAGIVSARDRNVGPSPYEDLIQIDAPLNSGSAGGPNFDLDGNVIGVTTMIASPSGGSIGIAFAVQAETLRTVIPQLMDKGFVTRGWIGVEMAQPAANAASPSDDKKTAGATVEQAQPDGPAAKAGIMRGDTITSVDGEPIKDAHDLGKRIGRMQPGATAPLGVRRRGEEKIITVTLGELSAKRQPRTVGRAPGGRSPGLGLLLAPARAALGSAGKGVVVADVDPRGSAAQRGLSSGDLITEVGGESVSTPDEVQAALRAAREAGKHFVLMQVKSGDATRFVAMPADPT
jgi:serine protease Do